MNWAPHFLAAQNTFFLSIPAGHISNAWFVQCRLLGTPPGTCRPSGVHSLPPVTTKPDPKRYEIQLARSRASPASGPVLGGGLLYLKRCGGPGGFGDGGGGGRAGGHQGRKDGHCELVPIGSTQSAGSLSV